MLFHYLLNAYKGINLSQCLVCKCRKQVPVTLTHTKLLRNSSVVHLHLERLRCMDFTSSRLFTKPQGQGNSMFLASKALPEAPFALF